jgi:drug/metabolite transporter (DMT)-like permease
MSDNLEKDSSSKYSTVALIALILTTVLWGTSFIITKTITKDLSIFLYLFLRYVIAIAGFIPLLIIRFKSLNKKLIFVGFISGIIYFISIAFQTIGLQTTTAEKGGFITGLGTIFVPFILRIFFKKKIKLRIWIAATISVVGMGFLLLEGESDIIIGDILVLICGIFYAIFIVMNDIYVKEVDVYLYSFFQLLTLALLSLGTSFFISENLNLISKDLNFWMIILYMGLITTTLTFLFQNWGQQHQSSSRTAIIFTLEPVFAAFFGFLLGGEIFTLFGLLGAIMIFVALIITVVKNNGMK